MTGTRPVPRSPRPRARRHEGIRVADVALGVAVTAVGLAWGRAYCGQTLAEVPSWPWRLEPSPYWRIAISPVYGSVRNLVLALILLGSAVAATGAIALVALRRLRRPRAATPFWRARRPGEMASLIASAMLVGLLIEQGIWPSEAIHLERLVGPEGNTREIVVGVVHDLDPRDDWGKRIGGPNPILTSMGLMGRWTGLVILGAWLGLAGAGRWRPAGSGTERLGRLLGSFWIAAAFQFVVFPT